VAPQLHQGSNSHTNEHFAPFSVTSSSSASDANAINPAGLSGPSTAVNAADSEDCDPGGIDNNVSEPAIDADKTAWLNLAEHDELAECLDTCVDRWRNAGPEARKKMYALFTIAGIFLAVCRHGHVLVICDMIRSGEL
jgi:Kyakuja-Dileera-Zisupton transposase